MEIPRSVKDSGQKRLLILAENLEKAVEHDAKHERKQAHALLDLLPDEKLAAVRTLLEVMVAIIAIACFGLSGRRGTHTRDCCGT